MGDLSLSRLGVICLSRGNLSRTALVLLATLLVAPLPLTTPVSELLAGEEVADEGAEGGDEAAESTAAGALSLDLDDVNKPVIVWMRLRRRSRSLGFFFSACSTQKQNMLALQQKPLAKESKFTRVQRFMFLREISSAFDSYMSQFFLVKREQWESNRVYLLKKTESFQDDLRMAVIIYYDELYKIRFKLSWFDWTWRAVKSIDIW